MIRADTSVVYRYKLGYLQQNNSFIGERGEDIRLGKGVP